MLRILIVDDEQIILNGIRMMIEKNLELPFPTDIVTASNAPQALQFLENFTPDLILTDIRMPVMDGFDLIKEIRQNFASMNIVILTSHADFEYAQQAIRFQVNDFILKPIDQEILKNTITHAYQQKQKKEQSLVHSALMEIRNMMLYDLPAQELTSSSEIICQLFPHCYFTVIVISLSQTDTFYPEILKKILLRYYTNCHCFLFSERNQLIAICNHNQFHIKPTGLKQDFSRLAACDELWIGISISSNSYKPLHNLYTNAVQKIFYSRHFGESSSISEISLFTYHDCVRIFLENDSAAALKLFKGYLFNINATSADVPTPELIYQSFFHNIMLYLENNFITVPEAMVRMDCHIDTLDSLVSEVLGQLSILKNYILKNSTHDSNDTLTRQLLEYIQLHYQEDISLDDLADHVGMHPNYICTVFKKNVGQSYLVCLHKERVQVAKKLLRDTDFTIEQIASQVGYNSSSQLARIFRKYESVSPSDYRNMHN